MISPPTSPLAAQRAINPGFSEHPVLPPRLVLVADPEHIDPVFRRPILCQHIGDKKLGGFTVQSRVTFGGDSALVPPDWIQETSDNIVLVRGKNG
ncbi:hypothetical protein [Granulibacter bethesdensis]|uniref:hypothetical protein n=1 Tax=Granulibacter bethesdensis TaxID=364410 RepID=UPI00046D2B83|nr:hypothetical protein [Granulibacter bethesdensis]